MRSPLYPDVTLVPVQLEPKLTAYQCPKSQGYWIPLQSYMRWFKQQGHQVNPLPQDYMQHCDDDSSRPALFCPESGCLLQRFRVGHGLSFRIDRSSVTGGVWLDAGEWEALKSQNLHEEMHHIFTASYQKKLRAEELEQTVQQTFEAKLGQADYEKVIEFKKWMHEHPRSGEILSFLHGHDE